MYKYVFILLFGLNILGANDNTIKTSELELFLFKIGFESLLKDVDINKDKSSLNKNEIKNINEKIELIMSELYKDNRILLNDSSKNEVLSKINNKEFNTLKKEVAFLKKELNNIKEKKETNLILKKEIPINNVIKSIDIRRVVTNTANIYSKPISESRIIKILKRDERIKISSCDKFGWCKVSNKKEFIKNFLLK